MNVDPNEIKKFADMSSRWWDETGELKTLHDINPLRLQYIEDRCNGLMGKKVLDVGCGGGILTESLAAKGALVTGIDAGEAALKIAELHKLSSEILTQESAEIEYICTTAESFADQHAGEFDVVTCMELLEHVPDPSRLVNACLRLVKEDGQVFFSTLNRTPKAYVYAVLGAEYLLNMLPKGTHDYRRFIKPSELVGWIRVAGKEVQDISGLEYHPVSGNHRLGTNPDINYLLHAS